MFLPLHAVSTVPIAKLVLLNHKAVWGVLMAARNAPSEPFNSLIRLVVVWLLAQALGHSAGCVWNDICDRNIDGLVGKYNIPSSIL